MLIKKLTGKWHYFAILLLATAGFVIHSHFWYLSPDQLSSEDIYYTWLEGKRIIIGENPYARVLSGNIRVNDKYSTYFPVFYLFSALSQRLGFPEFSDFLTLWRPIIFIFHCGIAFLVLDYFNNRNLPWIGIASAAIVLFSRWSLYIIQIHAVEFVTIFFLLLSLILLEKHTRLALLSYSLSLGIKQIAIFLLPIYLIFLWKERDKLKTGVIAGFLIIVSVPFLTSLPFLILSFEGFVKSILFSATRYSIGHISVPSLDGILETFDPNYVGLKAKIPMLFLMFCLYLEATRGKIGIFLQSTVAMSIFLYFHSVLFYQYFPWVLFLAPFALVESLPETVEDGKVASR